MKSYNELIEEAEAAAAAGQHENARTVYAKALMMRPNSVALRARYADACIKSGAKSQALDSLRRLLMLDPDNMKAALVCLKLAAEEGESDAVAMARRVIRSRLGAVASRPVTLLRRALGRDLGPEATFGCPLDGLKAPQARQVREARDLLSSRHFGQAAAIVKDLVATAAAHPAIWQLQGFQAAKQGDQDTAFDMFERGLEMAPDSLPLRGDLITAAARAERFETATGLLTAVRPEQRQDGYILLAEAQLAYMAGKPDEAMAALEQVPDRPELRATKEQLGVRALSELGRFEEALAWAERLVESRPLVATPFILAALNRSLKPGSRLFDLAEKAVDNPAVAQEDRGGAAFALGMALKSAGEHEASIERFEMANALVDRVYDWSVDDSHVATMKQIFTPSLLARAVDEERGKGIVCVVGLPRSGSTLVSQIIGSHPDATTIGESCAIVPCLTRAREAGYPEKTPAFTDDFFEELGTLYLDGLHPEARKFPVIVDKELMKFLHLGLVKLMLPGARFVHTRRNPMDVCFSIYCNWFAGLHPYAYRQETIAHFHHLHDEVMAHWYDVIPGGVCEARYESIIADPEGETRRLLDCIGLPFHADCLNFHESRNIKRTASVYQVRQKIYSSSIDSWRRYEDRLQTLKDGLSEKPFEKEMA